jgi:hypothetical protein
MVAAVDQAIEDDDWEALHDRVDAGMAVFERGAPLEHVRFPQDQIRSRNPDRAEMANMCTAGWLRRCELEIAHVLDRFELSAAQRDGVRLAAYLLRRFGTVSPIVEEVARLQVAEQVRRVRRFAEAVSARGLTTEQVMAGLDGLVDWIDHARPSVLSFAAWFALRTATEEQLHRRWLSGISMRVCEACLDELEGGSVEDPSFDPQAWLLLAAATLFMDRSLLARVLAEATVPRQVTETERALYAAIQIKAQSEELRGIGQRLVRETEGRGGFADAALLRAIIQELQSEFWSR